MHGQQQHHPQRAPTHQYYNYNANENSFVQQQHKQQQTNQHQSQSIESNLYERGQSEPNSRYTNQQQITNHSMQQQNAANNTHQTYQSNQNLTNQSQTQAQSQQQAQSQSIKNNHQTSHQSHNQQQRIPLPVATQQQPIQQESFTSSQAYQQSGQNSNQTPSQTQQTNLYSEFNRQTPYQSNPSVDFASVTSVLSYPTPSPSQHSFASSSPSTITAPSPDVRLPQTNIQPNQQYTIPEERSELLQRPYSHISHENQYQMDKMQIKQPYGMPPYGNYHPAATQELYQNQMYMNEKDTLRKYRHKPATKPTYLAQSELIKDNFTGYPYPMESAESTLSFLEKTASSIDESKSAFKTTLSNITKPPTPDISPYGSSQSPSTFSPAPAKPKAKPRPRSKKAAQQIIPPPSPTPVPVAVPQMQENIPVKMPKEKTTSKRNKVEIPANIYPSVVHPEINQTGFASPAPIPEQTRPAIYPYSDYHQMHHNPGLAKPTYLPHSVSSQLTNSTITSPINNNASTPNIPSTQTTTSNLYPRSSHQSYSYQAPPVTAQTTSHTPTAQSFTSNSKETHSAVPITQNSVHSSLPSHYTMTQGSMPLTTTASNDLMSSAYSAQHYPPYMGKQNTFLVQHLGYKL